MASEIHQRVLRAEAAHRLARFKQMLGLLTIPWGVIANMMAFLSGAVASTVMRNCESLTLYNLYVATFTVLALSWLGAVGLVVICSCVGIYRHFHDTGIGNVIGKAMAGQTCAVGVF